MTKVEQYRRNLRAIQDWDPYLLQESGLPGPRANLELVQAVADEGDLPLFQRYTSHTVEVAPTNSPAEFLAFCGVVGLGRLLAEGEERLFEVLRGHASDPRWRIREAVCMALQRLGDVQMDRLLNEMRRWSQGSHLEQRAAAAALCEPRLLHNPGHARAVLQILDGITRGVESAENRRSGGFAVLRQGMGYCWSVAAAALPSEGWPLLERWLVNPDPDVRWIMKENLKKARLSRVDPRWVQAWRDRTKS